MEDYSLIVSIRKWEVGYEYQSILDEKWFKFKEIATIFLITTVKNCFLVIFAKNQIEQNPPTMCLDKVILMPTISKIKASIIGREILMEVPTIPQKRINLIFFSEKDCKAFYESVDKILNIRIRKQPVVHSVLYNFESLPQEEQIKILQENIPTFLQNSTFRAILRTMKKVWNPAIDEQVNKTLID